MFELHPQLEADSLPVTTLPLCQVRLLDNRLFPWLVLVPTVETAREITDLTDESQLQLMREISLASGALQTVTQAEKMNIAALGNQVSQLHIHVIARFRDDAAWPAPVWGKASEPYDRADADKLIKAVDHILKAK